MWRDPTQEELARALDEGSLFLEYQPIVGLDDDRTVKFETLARWRHERLVVLTASRFMHLLQDEGLKRRFDHWVIMDVCRQIEQWRAGNRVVLPVAINVNAETIEARDFVGFVRSALQQWKVSGDLLELELTEQTRVADLAHARNVFLSLRKLGIAVALDDFGTGYAGLSYAAELMPDCLKIDRSFILASARGSDRHCAAFSFIVVLAHALGMQITAEGIESEAHLRLAFASGCDHGQGYLLGRPSEA